ncbi:MAG: VpsR-related response regulator, partial [Pseudomonadota bacterium]|nr:VpsR-related response regulator [Pseudomonadota bacterium]
MEQKRPLVWLSAAPDAENTQLPNLPGWQMTVINSQHAPVLPMPDYLGKPVGVCVLADQGPPTLENTKGWLEMLPVTSWLAVVRRRQLNDAAVCRLIRDYC